LNLWKDGFGNLLFLAKMRLTLGRRRRAVPLLVVAPSEEEAPVRAQHAP
jgi:hypothetical protein